MDKYSLHLSPQSGSSDFETSPIVQNGFSWHQIYCFYIFDDFPSIDNLFIKVNLTLLKVYYGTQSFYYYKRGIGNNLPSLLSDICEEDFYRHEPLNEAHDSTFGILENYHCWRFHGSGVIVAFQIIGLIFFCTGMHHEYCFWGRQYAFVFPIYVRKYRKLIDG